MNDAHFFSRLQEIKNNTSPTHYGVVLSSHKNTDLKEWLISNTPNDCSSLTERMIIILDGNNPQICDFNNRMIYNTGKFRYCNKNCDCQQRDYKIAAQKSKQTRIEKYGSYWTNEMHDKSKETNIEKYGADHYLKSDVGKNEYTKIIQEKYGEDIVSTLQLDEVKEKIRQTNLQKYGVEYNLQIPETRDKISNTRIEKYGSYWTNEMHDKSKETNIEKYGADHYLKSDIGKNEYTKIIQEKYGEDIVSTLQLDEVKEKIRQTNIDLYGVEYVTQNSEIREKIKHTNIKKYGVEYVSQRHIDIDKLKELQNDEKFIEIYNSFDYVSDIMDYFGVKESCIHKRAKNLGLSLKYNFISKEQQDLTDFLLQYTIVEQSNRTLIKPKEIDIWLPEFNIGIEYNGLYYHHIGRNNITKNYHLDKTLEMEKLGYRLIHIFSDEWINKTDIVKSRLLNIINKTKNKIYARKTKLVELSIKDAKDFLHNNHIQGYCNSTYKYGLYHNDILVSVMTFGKPRFNKNYKWELLRFSNLQNTSVVGGASKLLNNFIKLHGSDIISYADRRWSVGNLYNSLGFINTGYSSPNYFYIGKNKIRETRNKYQKHKLKEKLEYFDEKLSERENMKINNYDIVYDCGNSIWVYDKGRKND
jgi:hypothetical protein